MGVRHAISDAEFARIEPLLPGRLGQAGGGTRDDRRFPDAVPADGSGGPRRAGTGPRSGWARDRRPRPGERPRAADHVPEGGPDRPRLPSPGVHHPAAGVAQAARLTPPSSTRPGGSPSFVVIFGPEPLPTGLGPGPDGLTEGGAGGGTAGRHVAAVDLLERRPGPARLRRVRRRVPGADAKLRPPRPGRLDHLARADAGAAPAAPPAARPPPATGHAGRPEGRRWGARPSPLRVLGPDPLGGLRQAPRVPGRPRLLFRRVEGVGCRLDRRPVWLAADGSGGAAVAGPRRARERRAGRPSLPTAGRGPLAAGPGPGRDRPWPPLRSAQETARATCQRSVVRGRPPGQTGMWGPIDAHRPSVTPLGWDWVRRRHFTYPTTPYGTVTQSLFGSIFLWWTSSISVRSVPLRDQLRWRTVPPFSNSKRTICWTTRSPS
jgi:hypothetical protein